MNKQNLFYSQMIHVQGPRTHLTRILSFIENEIFSSTSG